MALPTTSAEIRSKQAPHGAVDPNVKIPKAVLDAGRRSEAIQQAIAGDAEKSVAAQVEEQEAGRAPRRQQQDEPPPPDPNTPPGEEPAPHEEPPPPEGEAPTDKASYDRMVRSLQGRYEAELKRNRDAIATLSERLERADRERAQNIQPQQLELPHINGRNGSTSLTEQEIADYGPEFVDVMRRVAAETAAPLQTEIQNLRGQLGYVQAETGNAFLTRMNTTIGSAIPNWAELNKDPKFIAWSQLPDVFSGAIRKTLMQDAWNSGDPNRVTAFFQAFLAEEAATDPQGRGQRTPPPSRMVVSDTPMSIPPTSGAPLDLANLAAPGRAHSAGGTPAEKPVYTAAEITKFYTDVKLGRWRGREQQQAAIDQDIMMAQREGRIISDNRMQLPKDPYMR